MTSRLFLLAGVAKQKPVQTVRQTFRLQIGPVQQVHPQIFNVNIFFLVQHTLEHEKNINGGAYWGVGAW